MRKHLNLKNLNRLLIACNLFFLQSYLLRFNIGPYPTNLQEILITSNLAIFSLEVFFNKNLKQTIKNILNYRFTIILVALTILSTLTNTITDQLSLLRICKFIFFAAILVFIIKETSNQKSSKITFTQSFYHLSYGAAAFTILAIIVNSLGLNTTPDYRLNGPMDSSVQLALYLAPAIIFLSIEMLKSKTHRTPLKIATLITLLIGLLATRSMGAIGGIFACLIIYSFYQFKEQILKSKILKATILITTILVSGTIFYTKILPTLTTTWSSIDARSEIWLVTKNLLAQDDNLYFGLGPGQFENAYQSNAQNILQRPPLDFNVPHPHNIILGFMTNFGPLGVALITWIILNSLLNIHYHKKLKLHDPQLICHFIILYWTIHGFIDFPFLKNDQLFLLILIVEFSNSNLKFPRKH